MFQTITYTAFNKAKTISEGTYSATLYYGTDEQRRKMETPNNGTIVSTKYYVGDYEKIIAGSTIRELHYMGNAVYVRNTTGSTVTDTTYYLHKDHLGSLATVFISPSWGGAAEVVGKYSYDVCVSRNCDSKHREGRRRNYNDFTYTINSTLSNNYFDRFYTMHETVLSATGGGAGVVVELINMNGRLYDPLLARMLSPDNYVQAAGNTQSYNRYSYCVNNPLKYTDPSGNVFVVDDIIVAAFIGGMVNVMIQGMSGNINSVGDFGKAFGVGALAGAGGAFVGGAVAGAIGFGGFAGGAVVGGSAGFAGGFIGGAGNAWVQGASFGGGLKAGLIGGGMGAVTGGVIGGIQGAIQSHQQVQSFRKGASALGVDEGGSVPATDDFLNQAQKAWYPDAPMEYVDNFTVENVPKGVFDKHPDAYGLTRAKYYANSKILTGRSDVFFNQDLAFSSAKQLFLTMGHEFIHVSQFASLAGTPLSLANEPLFQEMREFHAYNYQNTLEPIGMNGFDASQMAKTYPNYFNCLSADKFSWTNTVGFK
jgi:RHS repeat-associated protein